MVALRHRGRPNERPLDVPEGAVDHWSAFGYVPVEGGSAATADESGEDEGLSSLTVAELKDEAESRGLPKSGTKAELVERIEAHDAESDAGDE